MRALDVVAGVMRHPLSGAVLLTQRPPHKVRGGFWEFPGGKIEPGESASAALTRELSEELGVVARIGELRFKLNHQYPDVLVRLQVYEVKSWRGELRNLDVADHRWFNSGSIAAQPHCPVAGADLRIASRLSMPPLYRITPDCLDSSERGIEAWLQPLRAQFAACPQTLCLFRVPSLDADGRRRALLGLLDEVHNPQRQLLVSRDAALATELGLGLQLTAAQLHDVPEAWSEIRGPRAASCHDAGQLHRAIELGCDWVSLSPVAHTTSHPGANTLGWTGFEDLAQHIELPVYALGGLSPADLDAARGHGAIGIAGISKFWAN